MDTTTAQISAPELKRNKTRLKTLINIAKGQLRIDDGLYRIMLDEITGKHSLKSMSLIELEQVLEHFKQKGFKPRLNPNKSVSNKRLSPVSGQSKIKQIDKIRAVWITMAHHSIIQDGSETALDAYVRRMTKRRHNSSKAVESVRWLAPAQANALLESLKQWHKRELIARIKTRGQSHSNSPKADLNQLGYQQILDLYLHGAYGEATHE